MEDVIEACGDFVPTASSQIDQVDFDDMDSCVDVMLGDNVLGDFLRDFYHNPGKNCACAAAFGDAVPSCLIHSLDDEVVVPGSLFKAASCLVGKACDAVEDICLEELEGLDQCLPPLDGKKSCYKIELDCALEGSMSLILPPQLTLGELPDTCQKVSEESMAENHIPDRLSAAYQKCGTDGFEPAQGDSEIEIEEIDIESSSYQGPPDARAQDTNEFQGTDNPEENEIKKSSQALLGVALAAIVGFIAIAFVFFNMMRTSERDDSDPSKNEFRQVPVIHSEGLGDNLVVPVNSA
mmetsp:Transcript_19522/g.36581  ORF Transcript_19522/g.36581 Transcript_19522/m.36581 type:complete len:294 (+) Transcript_19522:849-1730(+)